MKELQSIHTIVKKQENDFERGNTKLSKYVDFSLGETIARIDAAINSTFLHSQVDSKGNKKPYFNISNSAVNIWFRATDIDRSFIKIRSTPGKRLQALLATAKLQEWMRKARFGQFLNSWGRVLARNGSAVSKFTERNGEMICEVIPWSRIICDPVDFYNNPVSEPLYLTEQQLWERVQDNNYDEEAVKELINSKTARKTQNRQRKDNKEDYYEVYETHGNMSLEHLSKKEKDRYTYVNQMHVIAFLGKGTKGEQEFSLYKGKEKQFPYVLSHLLEEEGRVMAIGAVENLFNAQWMQNHSMKQVKDQLDFASKQFYQTADPQFLGTNVIEDLDNGHMFITAVNGGITQVNNQSHDTTQILNFAGAWKSIGNELNGISESMLGAAPKSGTAWRQTEALLSENYSLFEIMTENKGLAIDDMLRIHVLPWIKRTQLNDSEDIVAVLDSHEIAWIDADNLKVKEADLIADKMFGLLDPKNAGQPLDLDVSGELADLQKVYGRDGNVRSFKPDMLRTKKWKDIIKDLEWDVEIDVTGEVKDLQQAMTTLNTALQVMMNPAYMQNPDAQKVVGKALELSGTLSPLELQSFSSTMSTPQSQPAPVGQAEQLAINNQTNAG